MDIDVHLAEMPFDRLPGATCGDADLLVVISGRAARGERVPKPIVVRNGDIVGDVGEGRRTFVGGYHEVRIIALVADNVGRRNNARFADADVVGDVEQRRNEHLVGGYAFGLDGLAAAAGRQIFRNEAALGPDWDDHGVLDVLCLHQAENFGAEVLRAIRPANAAARHFAEAQMHCLKPRRIEENFIQWPRQWHIFDFAAREFDRDKLFHVSAFVALIKVGTDRGHNRVDEVTQDAVFIEAVYALQGSFNRR